MNCEKNGMIISEQRMSDRSWIKNYATRILHMSSSCVLKFLCIYMTRAHKKTVVVFLFFASFKLSQENALNSYEKCGNLSSFLNITFPFLILN